MPADETQRARPVRYTKAEVRTKNGEEQAVSQVGGEKDGSEESLFRIGPYRILEPLGEGGMGAVYLAEQLEPKRRVALKLIKSSLVSREATLRFEAERQALARMNHPNVAQVYDAGATNEGQPFFAMEHVPGEAITSYCDSESLGIEQRLELFIAVCRGVQHAHQKGIIHRDIKPSNLLVTEVEGCPTPKIIDFGIAKALDQPLTDRTLLTGDRIVGTPAYLSPEAIEISGQGQDVDTRCDVYALGVVLYELLVGARPFESDSGGFMTLAMRILEEEAPTPVACLAAQEAERRAEVAASRNLKQDALGRRLRGDLSWITMKAMAKERSLRYESAAELAVDVERFLNNEEVLACPPSTFYRAGKFIRRHKVGVVATTGALLALLGGTIGTSVGLVRARQAEAHARRQATTAERALDFMVELFQVSDPFAISKTGAPLGETITAREILDHGAEKLTSELTEEPEIRAALMDTVGKVYLFLGLYEDAQRLTEQALAIRRELYEMDHPSLAESLYNLAALRTSMGDFDSAERLYREALAMRRRVLGNENDDVAEVVNDLGVVLWFKGDYEGAEPLLREALALYQRLHGEHPWVALAMNNLADLLDEQGNHAEAEPLYRNALAMFRRTVGNEHPYVITVLNNLALLEMYTGNYDAAEPLFREALAIRRKRLGEDHPWVSTSLNNLARVLYERGDVDGAEPLLRQALANQRQTLGSEHQGVALSLNNLGSVMLKRGDTVAAEALFQEALNIRRQLLGYEHQETATTLNCLATLSYTKNDFKRCFAYVEDALGIFGTALPAGHWRIKDAESVLGSCLTGLGRFEEAEGLLRQSLGVLRNAKGNQSVYTRDTLQRLVDLYEAWGKPEQAAEYRTQLAAASHRP